MGLPSAQQLLEYFERTNREHPDPLWAKGAAICRSWLKLQNKPDVSQPEIDVLVAQLNVEPTGGSVWFDLNNQLRRWAKRQGFRA